LASTAVEGDGLTGRGGRVGGDREAGGAEAGVDISNQSSKHVDSLAHVPFDYVVTVCDETSAERCPVFPGPTRRLNWGFPDPSALQGSHEEKLARTREIRDMIKAKIDQWCEEICSPAAS